MTAAKNGELDSVFRRPDNKFIDCSIGYQNSSCIPRDVLQAKVSDSSLLFLFIFYISLYLYAIPHICIGSTCFSFHFLLSFLIFMGSTLLSFTSVAVLPLFHTMPLYTHDQSITKPSIINSHYISIKNELEFVFTRGNKNILCLYDIEIGRSKLHTLTS